MEDPRVEAHQKGQRGLGHVNSSFLRKITVYNTSVRVAALQTTFDASSKGKFWSKASCQPCDAMAACLYRRSSKGKKRLSLSSGGQRH